MISRRRVEWAQRNVAPQHCEHVMDKIGNEPQRLGGQIKISWQCRKCKHIEEWFTCEEVA